MIHRRDQENQRTPGLLFIDHSGKTTIFRRASISSTQTDRPRASPRRAAQRDRNVPLSRCAADVDGPSSWGVQARSAGQNRWSASRKPSIAGVRTMTCTGGWPICAARPPSPTRQPAERRRRAWARTPAAACRLTYIGEAPSRPARRSQWRRRFAPRFGPRTRSMPIGLCPASFSSCRRSLRSCCVVCVVHASVNARRGGFEHRVHTPPLLR